MVGGQRKAGKHSNLLSMEIWQFQGLSEQKTKPSTWNGDQSGEGAWEPGEEQIGLEIRLAHSALSSSWPGRNGDIDILLRKSVSSLKGS